jgi:3-dehydroquinate dehydratase-2
MHSGSPDMTPAAPHPDANWCLALGQRLRALRPAQRNWHFSLIDGPNMANLGRGAGSGGRDPRTYGAVSSLGALQDGIAALARGLGTTLETFTSYHEADILAHVYESAPRVDGFLINPAALTRFGVPCRLALTDSRRPFVELHFSNLSAIGWTGGVTTPEATAVVMGLREYSYVGALFAFVCALDAGRIAVESQVGSEQA